MIASIGRLVRSTLALVVLAACAATQADYADTWGPDIGSQMPAFELADATGQLRDFDSLATPSGLILFFTRSANW